MTPDTPQKPSEAETAMMVRLPQLLEVMNKLGVSNSNAAQKLMEAYLSVGHSQGKL